MGAAHKVTALAGTQTTGDHHLAVLIQGLADGFQGFLHRRVDKAAGVDDHHVGAGVIPHQ